MDKKTELNKIIKKNDSVLYHDKKYKVLDIKMKEGAWMAKLKHNLYENFFVNIKFLSKIY